MLRINFVLAWRNFWKNKLYSFINVVGLSIGISACLVIFLIVKYEFGFNREVTGANRIYRLYSSFSGAFSAENHGVPNAVGEFVSSQFPIVESSAAFHTYYTNVEIPVGTERKDFEGEKGVILSGPEYFTVFEDYTWLTGSPQKSLSQPFQVVLTRSQGEKYFGKVLPQEMLGNEIIYSDSLSVTVSGVVEDLGFLTDLRFTDFISASTIEKSWLKNNYQLDDWTSTNSNSQCIIKIKQGVSEQDLTILTEKISKGYKEHSDDNGWVYTSKAQPFNDLHYNATLGTFDNGYPAAHKPSLFLLIGVALLLIVIAAINFTNLETAQAVTRAKEVGIHKVLGGSRSRLMVHFLIKSVLIAAFAVLIALPLAEAALNYFTEFIPKGVDLDLTQPAVLGFLCVVTLTVGILSGAYPAFFLSSFLPVLALKNQISSESATTRTSYLRRLLIVFQFSFAQIFIAGTLLLGAQIRFMMNKDLGFDKDAILTFETPWWGTNPGKRVVLRNELERQTEIGQVSMHSATPSSSGYNSAIVKFNNGKEELETNAYRKFGDANYLPLFGIKLIAGRNFVQSDSVKEFVINETYSRILGFGNAHDALGKIIEYEDKLYPIVGVVSDFHTKSLHSAVDPVIMATDEMKNLGSFSVRLSSTHSKGELGALVNRIETIYKKYYPDEKFKYAFLDDTIASFYSAEERMTKLVRTATAVAIIISCLGLFGLASYTTLQRSKEIGIRKVVGASAANIVSLLSREFMLLVLIAFVISMPVVFWLANLWLDGFAYRTELGWPMLLLTAAMALTIAFITISYQAIKAARSNPVHALRSE